MLVLRLYSVAAGLSIASGRAMNLRDWWAQGPTGSTLSEEHEGKLYSEGCAPLERDPARPLEFEITHLKQGMLGTRPRLEGVARLRGCTVGVWREEATTFLLAFHCYADGGNKVILGVRQPDVDRDAWFPDEWWLQCHISQAGYDRFRNASSLRLTCTMDLWRFGNDWKLARPYGVATPGRGQIMTLI
jgi:hypothetical protein